MFDTKVKLAEVVERIKLKLEGVDDDCARFYSDDFSRLELSQEETYHLLSILKRRKFIEPIEINDPNDTFPISKGVDGHISEYPELFPGIFVIRPTKMFVALSSKEMKTIKGQKVMDGNSDTGGLDKPLPDGVTWQDLTFRLMNSQEVKILYKDKDVGIYSNEDMGMYKGSDKNPTKAWDFLIALSNLGGEMPSRRSNEKTSEKYRQWKKQLADTLMVFVGINEDPFEDAQAFGKYKAKFKVEAEPILRDDGEIREARDSHDNRYDDLDDVYKEVTALEED